MPDCESVRVKREKCYGLVKDMLWEVQWPVIAAIQLRSDGWDPEQAANIVARAIPTKQLKVELTAKKANVKAYQKPVVVEEKIFLSLPGRKREPYYVELRVAQGVIEVHPHARQQLIDQQRAGHA